MRRVISILALSFNGLLLSSQTFAWYYHPSLMRPILDSLDPAARAALTVPMQTVCPRDDQKIAATLLMELELSESTRLVPLQRFAQPAAATPQKAEHLAELVLEPIALCEKKQTFAQLTPDQVLRWGSVEDPDHGMDRNLPDSADPAGDRAFMGGSVGTTSQGFRHMHFGGWNASAPVATFQVPMRAMGQAPERARKMAEAAVKLASIPGPGQLWAYRVLGWSMHYLQDLAQPFHAVQIPNLAMVPWTSLFHLVRETTRTISNYHWAYEGYVLGRLSAPAPTVYEICLTSPERFSKLRDLKQGETIEDLAHQVADASISIGSEVGAANIELFGRQLKKPEFDLSKNQGTVDYAGLTQKYEHHVARDRLDAVTCKALANAALSSKILIRWFLNQTQATRSLAASPLQKSAHRQARDGEASGALHGASPAGQAPQ